MIRKLNEQQDESSIDINSIEEHISRVEDLKGAFSKSFNLKTFVMILIAFSWMFIFFLQGKGGIEGLLDHFSQIKVELLFLGLAITLMGLCLDAFAWKILLKTMKVTASTYKTIETYFISFSWGLLIPSVTASEIYVRISQGKKHFHIKNEDRQPSAGELFSSIVLHRLLGLLAFIPLSIPVAYGFVVLFDIDPSIGILFVTIIASFAVFAILFLLLIYLRPEIAIVFLNKLLDLLGFILFPFREGILYQKTNTRKFVSDYNTNLRLLASNPLMTFRAFLLSFLNAICNIAGASILVYAAGGTAPLAVIIVILFTSNTINLIPLGIPGMEGIKETVVATLYDKYEPFSRAGVISLLNSLNTFYIPVIIGIIFSMRSNSKNTDSPSINSKMEENVLESN